MEPGLTDRELGIICNILSKVPSLEKGLLFGSRASGRHRFNSDVDILLYGAEIQDVAKINSLLEETTLPYHFDLVIYDEDNIVLNEQIEQFGQVIYERLQNA